MRNDRPKPESTLTIVNERIAILLTLAEKSAKTHPERSRRYVRLARKLAMRYRVKMGPLRRKFCRSCSRIWIPGFNLKVRLKARERRVIYECECGAKKGFPYPKKGKSV